MRFHSSIVFFLAILAPVACVAQDGCLGEPQEKRLKEFDCIDKTFFWGLSQNIQIIRGNFSVIRYQTLSPELIVDDNNSSALLVIGFGDLREVPVLMGIKNRDKVSVRYVKADKDIDNFMIEYSNNGEFSSDNISVNQNGEVFINNKLATNILLQ